MFIFGARVEEIETLRHKMRTTPLEEYAGKALMRVFDTIRSGTFGATQDLNPLLDTITH